MKYIAGFFQEIIRIIIFYLDNGVIMFLYTVPLLNNTRSWIVPALISRKNSIFTLTLEVSFSTRSWIVPALISRKNNSTRGY